MTGVGMTAACVAPSPCSFTAVKPQLLNPHIGPQRDTAVAPPRIPVLHQRHPTVGALSPVIELSGKGVDTAPGAAFNILWDPTCCLTAWHILESILSEHFWVCQGAVDCLCHWGAVGGGVTPVELGSCERKEADMRGATHTRMNPRQRMLVMSGTVFGISLR